MRVVGKHPIRTCPVGLALLRVAVTVEGDTVLPLLPCDAPCTSSPVRPHVDRSLVRPCIRLPGIPALLSGFFVDEVWNQALGLRHGKACAARPRGRLPALFRLEK